MILPRAAAQLKLNLLNAKKAEKLCDSWLTRHLGQPFELTSGAHLKLSLECSAGGPAPAEGGEGQEA